MPENFSDRVGDYQRRIDGCLDRSLPPADVSPQRLHEAMRYAVFNGGKRVRPLLVFATGECLGVDPDLLDAPAAAIELIHAFSLVHDDLPAMDDDDLRRGKPTVHIRYDEATAILAADALVPLAFQVIARLERASAAARTSLVCLVADACGSIGMTGGQSIDLAAEGVTLGAAELERMYALKTGALIHASIVSASLLHESLDSERVRALDAFGRDIGIAFQIKDDILDVEGETDVIGKPTGSDAKLGKATWPSLFGLEASHARCDELLHNALAHLEIFGADANPLKWLARFIVRRGR
jgi:farnesyl diphosphate synthase